MHQRNEEGPRRTLAHQRRSRRERRPAYYTPPDQVNDYRADSIATSKIQPARGRDEHDKRDVRCERGERDVRGTDMR